MAILAATVNKLPPDVLFLSEIVKGDLRTKASFSSVGLGDDGYPMLFVSINNADENRAATDLLESLKSNGYNEKTKVFNILK